MREGRPVYYSAPSTMGGGHAFVCDGYNANGLFHFNFGWNGEGDGYYYLDELIPNGHSYFPFGHHAIMGIHPGGTQDYCNFELPLWIHYQWYYNILGNATPLPYANVPKTFTRLTSVLNDPQFPSTWRTIPTGATSEYVAHEEVLLQDGFLAEMGSDFYAHIVPCPSCATRDEGGTFADNDTFPSDSLADPKFLQQPASLADDATLKVYPNPTDDLLNVELSGTGIKSIVLYDLQGRVVKANHYSPLQGIASINVHNVPAGVYLLRVTDTEGRPYARKVTIR